MRAREFLIEYRDINNQAFKQWFRGSHVVDENGNPQVVYHGTLNNGQIDVFHDMSHFGTSKAASDRIDDILKLPPSARNMSMPKQGEESPHVYPVFLSIKNPITMSDPGDWHDGDLWLEILDKDEFYDEMEAELEEAGYENLSPYEIIDIMADNGIDPIDWLKKHNVDGIKYKNEFEDKGSISWIPFSGKQVVSAFGGNPLKEKLMIEQKRTPPKRG